MLSIRLLSRVPAVLLCLTLAASPSAFAAPRALTPDQARERIQKVHVDRFVCIRESNGIELIGRILSIDPEAFTMQTGNHPETTTIAYSDVVYVGGPGSGKTALIIVGATAGLAALSYVLLHNAYENSVASQPKLPAAASR